MIDAKSFELATAAASQYAKQFIDEFWPSEDVIDGDPQSGKISSPLLAAISRFMVSLGHPVINSELPAKGFGSWLCRRGNDYVVVVDLRQMRAWHAANGMPVEASRIRSILHELGHILLSEKRTQPRSGTQIQFIRSVEPIEEERAWVFAMVFSGIIMGHYSVVCRAADPPRDNSPQLRL